MKKTSAAKDIEALKNRCIEDNKPFWYWDRIEHAKAGNKYGWDNCCFNHIIGLPEKDGHQMPLFDYEKEIYDSLQEYDQDTGLPVNLWIKKATGLGITEFMLRYMAWRALTHSKSDLQKFTIVTGPRIDLAIDLINRLKHLFNGITFDDKNTVVNIGNVNIEAFPSHHLDSMRGLPNVKFILLDEADFFPPGQQEAARTVAERYIGKSGARIVMVSTPGFPGGLFEQMENENEAETKVLYKKLFLPYTVGLGNIYTKKEIQQAMKSPSFEREYNLKYGYGLGNIVTEADIAAAVEMGNTYDPTAFEREGFEPSSARVIGIDPAFGSSYFAFVVTEYVEPTPDTSQVRVLLAERYNRANIEDMLRLAESLVYRYAPRSIYIDAANPEIAESLRRVLGEQTQFDAYGNKKPTWSVYSEHRNLVQRVNFAQEGATMLTNLRKLIQEKTLAINPQFHDLIQELRVAKEKDTRAGSLDKTNNTMDLVDALRLSLKAYIFEPERE